MANYRRLIALLALLALALAASWPAPALAAPLPQPSPCATAVAAALAQRGKPYVWGQKGPSSFDCSGLTHYAWLQAGYDIGLSTYDQAARGVQLPCRLSDLAGTSTTCWEPGDLAFLRYPGGQHVSMYIGGGIFADAYNRTAGVILHDVAADSYYQSHFWQARRIVDCDGGEIYNPTPDALPIQSPELEQIPDIIGPVAFVIPQCGSCTVDGTAVLPETAWSGSWPVGFEALNLPLVFRTVISWLAWQIQEIIRQLLCYLLAMFATLASILATVANNLIYGVNSLYKLLVLLWLTLRAYFYAFWELLEDMRQLLALLGQGLAGLAEFGRLIAGLAVLIAGLIGQLLALLGQLALSLLGLLGWLGGLFLGFWAALQLALGGTVVPVQLGETHIIYRATRGMLEGVRDSQIGWVFYLLWAMAYVAFVTWLARFLSASEAPQ